MYLRTCKFSFFHNRHCVFSPRNNEDHCIRHFIRCSSSYDSCFPVQQGARISLRRVCMGRMLLSYLVLERAKSFLLLIFISL